MVSHLTVPPDFIDKLLFNTHYSNITLGQFILSFLHSILLIYGVKRGIKIVFIPTYDILFITHLLKQDLFEGHGLRLF